MKEDEELKVVVFLLVVLGVICIGGLVAATVDEFDTSMTNRQHTLGLMTRGDENAYVQTAVETNGWLMEIQSEVDELRETYAKPIEMTKQNYDKAMVCRRNYNFDDDNTRADSRFSWYFETYEEAMRAWMHPELIAVKEDN